MAQSESASALAYDDATNMNDSEIVSALMAEMNAEELRRLAAHVPAVSRPRGATKRQTAEAVLEQAPAAAATVAEGGPCEVSCTCGLSLSVADPEVAEAAAAQHKSDNPLHFPSARNTESDEGLYGC